jgi:hypothetical protein
MAKRILTLTLAVALVGVAGRAPAQQPQPGQKKAEGFHTGGSQNALSGPASQPEQKKAEGRHGPFAIAASGETAVLLDTASGKTWVLRQAGNGGVVWLPVRRLDSEQEVREWLEAERAKGTALRDQERARRAALEDRARARAEEAEKEANRLRMQEMVRRAQLDRERARTALEEAERRVRQLDQELKSPGR